MAFDLTLSRIDAAAPSFTPTISPDPTPIPTPSPNSTPGPTLIPDSDNAGIAGRGKCNPRQFWLAKDVVCGGARHCACFTRVRGRVIAQMS